MDTGYDVLITEYDYFDFGKHILKLDVEAVRKKLRYKFAKRLFHLAVYKENFEEMVKDEYDTLNVYYNPIKTFFEEMNNQKYCNIKHTVRDDKTILKDIEHTVEISGSGMETFNLNGLTRFHMIKDSKITTIPVEKNDDTFYLIIFGHPQIEIPTLGKIDITYEFDTSFSLGKNYRGILGTSTNFVYNPLSVDYFSLDGIERLWYGKPGEVYYRYFDGFYKEIKTAVIGSEGIRLYRQEVNDQELEKMLFKGDKDYIDNKSATLSDKRDKFKMNGTITFNGNNNFIYQGMIESSGAFPFFLWKGDLDSKIQRYLRPETLEPGPGFHSN